jgi:hypothetical protein
MAKKKKLAHGRPKTTATLLREKEAELKEALTKLSEIERIEQEKIEAEKIKPQPTQFELAMKAGKRLDRNGKVRATVMTQAGSEIVDEARRTNTGKYFDKDTIFKPKGE